MARLLREKAELVGPAQVQGRLYLVAHYPGLVDSKDKADIVFGELYRLEEGLFLDLLDRFEEYGPAFPTPNEFIRVIRPVSRGPENSINAWVYLFNREVTTLPLIPSGNFYSQDDSFV